MNAPMNFYRDLPLKPQGIIVVIAAFLPIIAITAMGPAVPALLEYFAANPDARRLASAMIGALFPALRHRLKNGIRLKDINHRLQ